ncbi:alpha/beta hydrolase [Effusibacillus consociatus]
MLQERILRGVGNRFRPNRTTELFYRSCLPSNPHLILVMIHGAGQHSGQFLDLGTYCSGHNIAFYALDLRGFGQSQGKRGHVNSFREYLDDLDHFIDHVRTLHPDHPVFLLGHSLGGTIVVRYGQERQNGIRGAILSAPALKLRVRIPMSLFYACCLLSWLIPGVCVELQRWGSRLARIPRFRSFFRGELSEKADPLATTQFSVRWFTELLFNGNQALRKARDFEMAVLCLCGTDDQLIDPNAVQEFYDFLQVEDKKYMVFPGVRHRLLQDNTKELVYEQIVNWLKERS